MMDPRNPVFERTSLKPGDFPTLSAMSQGYLTPPSPPGMDSITLGVNDFDSAPAKADVVDPDIQVQCPVSAISPREFDEVSPRWDWDNELNALKD